ncbi:hypothetical protein [Streptomyces sp. NPDC007264]|uniref:hypothetical protein n=1 Tax=Streptomyces sp. NPDC007264 TaxID=3364777 RepID=UPI0036D966BA
MPIPYLTREDVTITARTATSRLPGRPSARGLVFYGGLGAMAVAGALDWPVALAVGGAAWLVRGRRRDGAVDVPAEHDGSARGAGRKSP